MYPGMWHNSKLRSKISKLVAGRASAYWRRVPFDRRSAQQKSPALKRPKIFKLSWMAPLASECSFAFVLPCPSAMQMGARDAGLAQGKSHSTLRRAAVSLKLAGEGGAMLQSQASLGHRNSRGLARNTCAMRVLQLISTTGRQSNLQASPGGLRRLSCVM